MPSNSFGQELDSAAAVKDFCEVNFSLDFPMTGLVEVTGPDAHPFYAWAAEAGHAPTWNFHKLLLDGEGAIVAQLRHSHRARRSRAGRGDRGAAAALTPAPPTACRPRPNDGIPAPRNDREEIG